VFDPLPACAASPSLASQPTSFVDRRAELAERSDLLAAPDCRPLTIVRPRGVGKIRLALVIAAAGGANHAM
jgi:hypothetical protein